MIRIRDIRHFAWRQLKGKRGTIVGAYLLFFFACAVAGILIALPAILLFGLYSGLLTALPDAHLRILMPASGIVAALVLILAILLFSGLALGIQRLFLQIARGRPVKISDVLSGFRAPAHWMRYTGTALILAAVQFLLILPVELASLAYGESSPNTSIIQTIMQALSIVASLHLFPLTYISADHPEYSPWDCLGMSFHLMRKRKGKLFLLWLSFWPLICVLVMVPILAFGICYMAGMHAIAFSMLFMLSISAAVIFLVLILPHMLTAECTFYLYMYREDYGDIPYADTPPFFRAQRPFQAWTGQAQAPPPQGHPWNNEDPLHLLEREQPLAEQPGQVPPSWHMQPGQPERPRQDQQAAPASQAGIPAAGGPAAPWEGGAGEAPVMPAPIPETETPRSIFLPEEKGPAAMVRDTAPSPEDPGETPARKPLSYKAEEDGWDSYLRWKRDRGISAQTGPENAEAGEGSSRSSEEENLGQGMPLEQGEAPVRDEKPEQAEATQKDGEESI